ncbi:copper resistance CopC family protein [Leucobacter sp. GX24907]
MTAPNSALSPRTVPTNASGVRGLRGRLVAISAIALATIGFLMSPTSPAHAHDELINQTVEVNEDDGSAEAVRLTFSNSILDVGTEIVITGPEGDATDGAPVTKGPDVTQALADNLALGDYNVAWRVVSSDGHPIDGTFEFTVQEDGVTSPDSDPAEEHEHEHGEDEAGEHSHSHDSDSHDSDAADAESTETDGSDNAEAANSDEGLSLGALIGIAVAASLFAIGVTVVAVVSMRRKQAAINAAQADATQDDAAQADAAQPSDPTTEGDEK